MKKLFAMSLLIATFAVAGCGGGSESAGPTEEEGATLTAGGDTETSGGGDTGIAGDDRCLPVPKALIDGLEDGLRKKGKDTGIEPTGIGEGGRQVRRLREGLLRIGSDRGAGPGWDMGHEQPQGRRGADHRGRFSGDGVHGLGRGGPAGLSRGRGPGARERRRAGIARLSRRRIGAR